MALNKRLECPFMADIVKYQNELNLDPKSYPVFKLTEIEQNIFMALLSQTTFNDDQWVRTNLYDLREKISYYSRSMDGFIDEIDNLLEKICSQKIKIKRGSKVFLFVCFDKLEYDEKTNDLAVHFQDDFYHMVKNYQLGFTRFELAEFVSLSGAYAKTLYRQLKQFKTQGWWFVELADFKRLLNIPENYRQCDINTRILKPCIKQLSRESDLIDEATGSKRIPFKNLSVRKISERKRGQTGRGAVTALKFTFDPQLEVLPQNEQSQEVQQPQEVQNTAPDFSEFEKQPQTATENDFFNMTAGEFASYYCTAMKDTKTDKTALIYALGARQDKEEIIKICNELNRAERKAQFNNALSASLKTKPKK